MYFDELTGFMAFKRSIELNVCTATKSRVRALTVVDLIVLIIKSRPTHIQDRTKPDTKRVQGFKIVNET